MTPKKNINISNKTVAYNGAVVSVAAVFAYSMIVMIYTLIRSSSTIYSIMPENERIKILLANGFSIAYSIVIFSILMSILTAVAGALAAIILKKSLQYLNPLFTFRRSVVISCIAALALLTFVYLLLFALLKSWMTLNYIETFSFWFIFPACIFLAVCIIGGTHLNRILKTGLKH